MTKVYNAYFKTWTTLLGDIDLQHDPEVFLSDNKIKLLHDNEIRIWKGLDWLFCLFLIILFYAVFIGSSVIH